MCVHETRAAILNADNLLQLFDKVTVLYEGRQIYFGRIGDAKKFFIDLGFECPDRQTTADFLTVRIYLEYRIVHLY